MEKRAIYESPEVNTVSFLGIEADIITASPVGAGGYDAGDDYENKDWE